MNMETSLQTFLTLPHDCLISIFEFCDVKSLCRLSQTCKTINRLVNSDIVWSRYSKSVLGSNMVSSSVINRSKPIIGCKKRCEISGKWKKSKHMKTIFLKYSRCMPWLYVEKNYIFCSHRNFIVQFNRDENGCIKSNKVNKIIPHLDDVSKFVVNGDEIVSAGRDGTLSRCKMSPCKSICRRQAHFDDVICLDAKENIIVSGSKDCSIKIWKAEERNTSFEKVINVGIRVLSLAIMPGNRQFVAGLPGIDIHPLQLFDLESVSTWTDPYDNIIYCVCSDNNVTIVSGANRGGIVHIWDKRWRDCQVMHFFSECNSPTFSVGFDACHLFAAFDKSALHCSYL